MATKKVARRGKATAQPQLSSNVLDFAAYRAKREEAKYRPKSELSYLLGRFCDRMGIGQPPSAS